MLLQLVENGEWDDDDLNCAGMSCTRDTVLVRKELYEMWRFDDIELDVVCRSWKIVCIRILAIREKFL